MISFNFHNPEQVVFVPWKALTNDDVLPIVASDQKTSVCIVLEGYLEILLDHLNTLVGTINCLITMYSCPLPT